MCAALYLPLAKTLDIFGRPIGLSVMTFFATLGLILMATTSNVETYCAAQVFYNCGFVGIIFAVDITTSDTSSLRDRGLAFAFTSSPYIITALSGPVIAEYYYENISWRWAFGTFAIILPIVVTPLLITLMRGEQRAKQQGLITSSRSDRTFLQSVRFYIIEFDGMIHNILQTDQYNH